MGQNIKSVIVCIYFLLEIDVRCGYSLVFSAFYVRLR